MSLPAAPTFSRSREWAILGVLCLSVFLGIVENTILNVALPSIRTGLGASTSELQWITDAYVLVLAGFVLVGGSLADRWGRKGAMTCGLLVIGVFSALATFANAPWQLVALRAVLGLGAAFVFPTSLAILVNVFTDPVRRGRAIAVWGATAGVSAAAGPIIGGLLLRVFSWHAVFWVNVVIVALALLGGRLLPTSRNPNPRRLDLAGATLSVLALSTLVWSIIEGQHGWGRPVVLLGFTAAAVLFVAFVMVEKRVQDPMLELDVLRNPRVSVASGAVAMAFFVLNGSLFVVTMYLQSIRELSPLQAGLCTLPGGLAMIAVAQLGARLVERLGVKLVVTTGFVICGVGLFQLSGLTVGSNVAAAVVAITVFYAGLQFISAPAATSIMNAIPKERAGMGSALNNVTRQLGTALGIAVFGSILGTAYRGQLDTAGLGPSAAADAGQNVGAAMEIARRTGNGDLAASAKEAFVTGMANAMVAGVVIFAVVALATMLTLPGRERAIEPKVVRS